MTKQDDITEAIQQRYRDYLAGVFENGIPEDMRAVMTQYRKLQQINEAAPEFAIDQVASQFAELIVPRLTTAVALAGFDVVDLIISKARMQLTIQERFGLHDMMRDMIDQVADVTAVTDADGVDDG